MLTEILAVYVAIMLINLTVYLWNVCLERYRKEEGTDE
jgi:hypothetical protein